MPPIPPTAWLTLGTIIVLIALLVRDVLPPMYLLLGALAVLLVGGVLSPAQAFSGFANPAVLTVGALYVVAAGIEHTGALAFLNDFFGGRSQSLSRTLFRVTTTSSLLSGVVSNTPVVAMLIPRLQQWGRRNGVSPSKLLIPLSYASIAGGMLTLIGTSTNLVVDGLMQAEGLEGLSFFDVTWVGVPVTMAIVLYFLLGGHRLLPDQDPEAETLEEGLDNCLFELRVGSDAPFIGQTVEEAGLRALEDAYLAHVRRGSHLVPASPEEVLQAGDVLTFSGRAGMWSRLMQRSGFERTMLSPEGDGHDVLPLYEAVVAPNSNLVGKTLREANFRDEYQGVVLAIQRKDEQIGGPLGRTPIKPGDLLLIEAPNGFDARWNARRDVFYLVAPRKQEQLRTNKRKAPIAVAVLGVMIAVAASGLVPIATAAFVAALLIIAFRCLPPLEARQSVNVQVLVVIAAALGLGQAIEVTGLASALAQGLMAVTLPWGSFAVLAGVYIATNVLTEAITNNAAAVLMLPIALSAAADLGLDPTPFAIAVTIAASASFLTPIGYQTNLMVMSPGGYRVRDYLRVGLPVTILVATTSLGISALIWF